LAKEVQYHLNNNYEVIGFVEPGAAAEMIVNSTGSDIVNLTKSDAIVFCGGSHQVSKNMTNVALKHITNFVNGNHNNLIKCIS
jgi:hypothetical protein